MKNISQKLYQYDTLYCKFNKGLNNKIFIYFYLLSFFYYIFIVDKFEAAIKCRFNDIKTEIIREEFKEEEYTTPTQMQIECASNRHLPQ